MALPGSHLSRAQPIFSVAAGLMITTLVSYLSHSQVWALQQEGLLHIGGRTNRATLAFAGELSNILDAVPDRGTGQSRSKQSAQTAQTTAEGNEAGVFVPDTAVAWQAKPAERSPSRSDSVPDDAVGNLNGGSIGFASVDDV